MSNKRKSKQQKAQSMTWRQRATLAEQQLSQLAAEVMVRRADNERLITERRDVMGQMRRLELYIAALIQQHGKPLILRKTTLDKLNPEAGFMVEESKRPEGLRLKYFEPPVPEQEGEPNDD
jgi:hypothetical protein